MADDDEQNAPANGGAGSGARGRRVKLHDMVADGVYVAAAATRLSLKNRILIVILADGNDFDSARFTGDARETLLALADEADADAARTCKEGKLASRRYSESDGTHDYRSRDVRNLKRRRKQSERVAAVLRERAENPAELSQLVEAAREAAWAEVSRNIDRRLSIESERPDLEPDYDKLRAARMQALRLVDLPRLSAHRRANAAEASGKP